MSDMSDYNKKEVKAFKTLCKARHELQTASPCLKQNHLYQTILDLIDIIKEREFPDLEICEGCDNIAEYTDSEGIYLCAKCWDICRCRKEGEES